VSISRESDVRKNRSAGRPESVGAEMEAAMAEFLW
jgi:hypothetical protein